MGARHLVLGLSLAGCIESGLVLCADGRACPVGTACDDAHHNCVTPDQLTACDGKPDLMPCTASSVPDGVCFAGVCLPAGCGNGEVELNEACDDGNLVSGDGCSADCASQERCGDGVTDITRGETCDDGNLGAHDGCASTCEAENLTWRRELGVAPPSIPARDGAAIVYDPIRRVTVAFGGEATVDFADTWEWNGAAWTEVTPFVSPPSRRDHALAYDPIRHRIVLFGGTSLLFGALNDTWEFDGATWEHMTTVTAPPPRTRTAMVWDSALHKIVLFGGIADTVGLDDTWTWDGRDWVRIEPPSRPQARGGHGMTYDVAHARVVVLGGSGAASALADAWAFDGATWTPLSTTGGPTQFKQSSLVYDAKRSTVVAIVCTTANELQTWELSGASWHQVTTASPSSDPRILITTTSYTFDIERDQILEWSGASLSGASNVLYVLDRGASPTWSTLPLVGTATIPLHPHMLAALAYDTDRARTILFGGQPYIGGPVANDTLEWNGTTWLDRGQGATARAGAAMAWDGVSHRVILFGGTSTVALGDTWAWNGSSWADVTPAGSPPARTSAAMAYDSARHRVVMFGGVGRADTWEWDGSAWHDVTPASSPGVMAAPMLAYDSHRARTVLFGGQPNETWEWDGTAWSHLEPIDKPEPRSSGAMIYNTARQRVLLIGGFSGSISEWEWDGSTWSRPAVASIVPVPMAGNIAAYDEARGQIVKVGGQGAGAVYDTTTWLGAYTGPSEEVCGSGHDVDGDGRTGCADEDCAGACAQCGDGTCSGVENDRLCPADCPAPTPICGDAYCASGETCAADCTP